MPQLTIVAIHVVDVFSLFLSDRPAHPYCMETLASAINNKLKDVQYAVYFSAVLGRLYLEYKYSGKLVRIVDTATVDELKKKWPDDAVAIIGEITELDL